MIFVLLLLLELAVYYFYRKTKNTAFLFLGLAAFCVVILSPSVSWPYILDDIDNFYAITALERPADVVRYALTPGDGHFIPVVRLLYFSCFKLFWLNPAAFHALIIFSVILTSFLFMGIVYEITASWVPAVFCGALIGWSTGYLQALETCFSHMALCLPWIGAAVYSLLIHKKTGLRKWLIISATATFVAPCISAIGILAGLWAALFLLFCDLPKEQSGQRAKRAALFWILAAWFLSVMIFFAFVKPLSGGGGITRQSFVLNFPYLLNAVLLAFKSLWLYTIPLLTSFEKMSLFMGIFFFIMALIKHKEIPWKIILLFFGWMMGCYVLIYYGRGYFEEFLISTERYHFPASLGLPAIYAIVLSVILKDKEWNRFKRVKYQCGYFIAMVFIAAYAFLQHHIVWERSQGRKDLSVVGLELRKAVGLYLGEHKKETIRIANRGIDWGSVNFPDREFKLYGTILLFPEFHKNIIWGDETEGAFIEFLRSKESDYPVLVKILERGHYF